MGANSETLMPDEATQPLSNILQTIKTIVLSLQLLDEKCFETLVIDSNYFDVPCLKLVRNYFVFSLINIEPQNKIDIFYVMGFHHHIHINSIFSLSLEASVPLSLQDQFWSNFPKSLRFYLVEMLLD